MNGHKFEFEVLDRRGGDRVLLLIYIYILCIYTSVAEWLLWLVKRLGETKSPCLRGKTSS